MNSRFPRGLNRRAQWVSFSLNTFQSLKGVERERKKRVLSIKKKNKSKTNYFLVFFYSDWKEQEACLLLIRMNIYSCIYSTKAKMILMHVIRRKCQVLCRWVRWWTSLPHLEEQERCKILFIRLLECQLYHVQRIISQDSEGIQLGVYVFKSCDHWWMFGFEWFFSLNFSMSSSRT